MIRFESQDARRSHSHPNALCNERDHAAKRVVRRRTVSPSGLHVVVLQASPRLKFDEALVKRLWDKIQGDEPSDTIFDEIQARVRKWHLV